MKVLVADDNTKFRESLKFMMQNHIDLECIAEACNGLEAVELAKKYFPDLVLMDIEMPILNGIEAAKQILLKCPTTKIIAISMHKDNAYLPELIHSGFKAFISKIDVSKEFDTALTKVMKGSLYFPENIRISK